MTKTTFISILILSCACVAASTLNAATIPAGTMLTVQTVGLVSSKDAVGRTFEAKIAQDVSANGKVLLKTGTKAFGRVRTSRADRVKPQALSVELMSILVNGQKVAVKTNGVQPGSPPMTARQLQYGHTAGTTVVNPGTRMQFQLLKAVTF